MIKIKFQLIPAKENTVRVEEVETDKMDHNTHGFSYYDKKLLCMRSIEYHKLKWAEIKIEPDQKMIAESKAYSRAYSDRAPRSRLTSTSILK